MHLGQLYNHCLPWQKRRGRARGGMGRRGSGGGAGGGGQWGSSSVVVTVCVGGGGWSYRP